MKVSGTSGVGSSNGAPKARVGGGAGFRLPGSSSAAGPTPASAVSAASNVMGMDALLALQDVGGPLERKRRAVSRAGRILDVLDDLKLGLLEGSVAAHDFERLRRAVRDARDRTDDPQLESVLDEIEIRAAVEMAKLEMSSRAA